MNLPDVATPPPFAGQRLGFLHDNVPGVLATVNALLADEGDNVIGQHLSTRGELGYVVTDADRPCQPAAWTVAGHEHCVWVRTW